MTRDAIVRFVRRGRARLEVMRLLRGAARGALAGGAAGLVLSLAGWLGLPVAAWLPWACAAAGAIAGFAAAALGEGVPLPAAALLLDFKLNTQERLVTVVTRENGPFADRLLRELDGVEKLPRLTPPREVSLVPAALFLLFAAGLLPRANGEEAAADETLVRGSDSKAPVAVGTRPAPPDVANAVRKMARGEAPTANEVEDLRKVIERRVLRPEERKAALAALQRAAEGDGEAAREVAKELKESSGPGSRGRGDDRPDTRVVPRHAAGQGGGSVDAYPEHRELVLAYRRALAEEKK